MGEITLYVAQIVNTLHKGYNRMMMMMMIIRIIIIIFIYCNWVVTQW